MRRLGLLVLGIGLCVGLYLAFDRMAAAAISEEARVAIDVRCRNQNSRAARECRAMLERLFLAGSLDPDKTLRAYCYSVKNALWGGSRPAPPKLCVQRYGGWPES